MIPFYVSEKPDWMTVTLMSKNEAGEWIPLITGEEWQTRVMKADQRPLIAARLQGTPAERGKVRVNIKGMSYRNMCGNSDPGLFCAADSEKSGVITYSSVPEYTAPLTARSE